MIKELEASLKKKPTKTKKNPYVVEMPVISAFGRSRQEDQEFKTSLSYTANSRPTSK